MVDLMTININNQSDISQSVAASLLNAENNKRCQVVQR